MKRDYGAWVLFLSAWALMVVCVAYQILLAICVAYQILWVTRVAHDTPADGLTALVGMFLALQHLIRDGKTHAN